jgi:hypothetical protein
MPSVTNPYPGPHAVGNGPVVGPGESVEVSDEEAESLVAQGWKRVADHPAFVAVPARARKADVPEPEVSTDAGPASPGEEKE